LIGVGGGCYALMLSDWSRSKPHRYAAIEEVDKVQYIAHIKTIPTSEGREAEMALFCREPDEGEVGNRWLSHCLLLLFLLGLFVSTHPGKTHILPNYNPLAWELCACFVAGRFARAS
jgi:hypothetical protein